MKKLILFGIALFFAFQANAQNEEDPRQVPPYDLELLQHNFFNQQNRISEDSGLPEQTLPYPFTLAEQGTINQTGITSLDGNIKYFIQIVKPKLENSIPIPNGKIDQAMHFHILQQKAIQ